MRHACQEGLLDHVFSTTIPMRGRMIHGKRPTGELYEEPQDYDVHGRVRTHNHADLAQLTRQQTIFAVDRAGLNKRLLDTLDEMPNVSFFFNHKLTGADFERRKAWFEVRATGGASDPPQEIEVGFDFMMGADGAHSSVRHHLMRFVRMDFSQEYIDTLWCEFRIEARTDVANTDASSKFRISPNHLHIWPGKRFMFIAIPSEVRSGPPPRLPPSRGLTFSGRLLHLHTLPSQRRIRSLGIGFLQPTVLLRSSLPRRNVSHPPFGTYLLLRSQPSPTSDQHQMLSPSFLRLRRHPRGRRARHGSVLRTGDECRTRRRADAVLYPRQILGHGEQQSPSETGFD